MTSATPITGLVCFNHGKESGPWGSKISRLARVAEHLGFAVKSPDYSHTVDPQARVQQLLTVDRPQGVPLVLVGSSMGGYVAAQACSALSPAALFLMAPALYFPGWDEEPEGIPTSTVVVHGWRDDVVPLVQVQRFAARHRADFHLFDADHGLSEALEPIADLFARQLGAVLAAHEPSA